MKVYIARHGQTVWNVEERWQGSRDIPLDDVGLLQAEKLAEKLARYPIQAIYSSPLQRAAATAQAAADKLGLVPSHCDHLREISLGEWEGHSFFDIRQKYPREFEEWERNPKANVGMGVECNFSVQTRAYDALVDICLTEKRDTLIVSHGGWINRLVCRLLGIPLKDRMLIRQENTGLNIIECALSYDPPRFVVITLNDYSHLI